MRLTGWSIFLHPPHLPHMSFVSGCLIPRERHLTLKMPSLLLALKDTRFLLLFPSNRYWSLHHLSWPPLSFGHTRLFGSKLAACRSICRFDFSMYPWSPPPILHLFFQMICIFLPLGCASPGAPVFSIRTSSLDLRRHARSSFRAFRSFFAGLLSDRPPRFPLFLRGTAY